MPNATGGGLPIPQDLLDELVCPACRKPVRLTGEAGLQCEACERIFPIRDGIPIMLLDEATPGSKG